MRVYSPVQMTSFTREYIHTFSQTRTLVQGVVRSQDTRPNPENSVTRARVVRGVPALVWTQVRSGRAPPFTEDLRGWSVRVEVGVLQSEKRLEKGPKV